MSNFSGPFNRQTELLDRIADAITGTDELDKPKGNRALDSLERLAIWFETRGGIPTSSGSSSPLLYGSNEEWNSQSDLIGQEGVIYVYTDYQTLTDAEGNVSHYPNIKIGDGVTLLSNLPFLAAGSVNDLVVRDYVVMIQQNLEEQGRLVSNLDREKWDQIGNINAILENI